MRHEQNDSLRGRRFSLNYGARICRLIEKAARQRGENAEEKVTHALRSLHTANIIRDFRRIPVYGREQRKGIDFTVTALNGDTIPFQVKSSIAGAAKHRHRYPNVPVVIVTPGMDHHELARVLCRELGLTQTPV